MSNVVKSKIDLGTQVLEFGRSGNVPKNSWLLHSQGVPTNIVGSDVVLDDGEIDSAGVHVETAATFGLEIYSHDGNLLNLILLTTITVVADTDGEVILRIPVPLGKQIAARTITNSVRNPSAHVLIRGTVQ